DKDDEEDDLSFYLQEVTTQDLHKFGMIPEFVGRIPVRAALKELTEDELVKVLVEPKNAIIKQFRKQFAIEKVSLEFTDGALKEIANSCIRNKSGARGLRTILETRLLELQFNLPDLYEQKINRIIIGKEFISGDKDEPIMDFVDDTSE